MRSVLTTACALAVMTTLPATASAQVFVIPPDFSGAPVTGSEVGLGLPMPGATAQEYSAAMIWNMRAGLNVAALQCQGSLFLDAVDNYNRLLANHSDELAPAYKALQGYFIRLQGAKPGTKAFDDYNTRTYNGFSTLYAQPGFCHTAASIGRDLRFAPKAGGMLDVSRRRMREFRNSLVPVGDGLWATRSWYYPLPIFPDLAPQCYDKNGMLKRKCQDRPQA